MIEQDKRKEMTLMLGECWRKDSMLFDVMKEGVSRGWVACHVAHLPHLRVSVCHEGVNRKRCWTKLRLFAWISKGTER